MPGHGRRTAAEVSGPSVTTANDGERPVPTALRRRRQEQSGAAALQSLQLARPPREYGMRLAASMHAEIVECMLQLFCFEVRCRSFANVAMSARGFILMIPAEPIRQFANQRNGPPVSPTWILKGPALTFRPTRLRSICKLILKKKTERDLQTPILLPTGSPIHKLSTFFSETVIPFRI